MKHLVLVNPVNPARTGLTVNESSRFPPLGLGQVAASGIDVMQTTYLTALPGTRQFERYREEDRLLYPCFPQDWDHYDMGEVTHRPLDMTARELAQATHDANRRMYSWPVLVRKALRTLRDTRNPMATLFAWHSNLNYRRVAFASQPPG
jgi:hypothetical protein